MTESDTKNTGTGVKCDESKCIGFSVLTPGKQNDNRWFRKEALEGKETPEILNSMCGNCIKEKMNEVALEEEIKKPFTYKPQTELQKAT